MKILVTLPEGSRQRALISPEMRDRLERCGAVVWNPHARPYTIEELSEALHAVTVCITGWQTPTLDSVAISEATSLRLVAHVGGTIASIASNTLYERGVRISSANRILAMVTAEAALGYMLAGLRDIPAVDLALHAGKSWPRNPDALGTLFGATIGLVGLGMVGRSLLDLLTPFAPHVLVFDPLVDDAVLARWPFARRSSLESTLQRSTVVSLHAPLNPTTVGLLDRTRLRLLRDGALLVNTARGALVDEAALIEELSTGRIRACLDVYAREPMPLEHPLRRLSNVVLGAHQAGAPSHSWLFPEMVAEVERFIAGRPLQHEISHAHFAQMTRASDSAGHECPA